MTDIDPNLIDETTSAIRNAIKEQNKEGQGLTESLHKNLSAVNGCPITLEDALGIAYQSIEDTGTTDVDGPEWLGYDAMDEGVENHALYHAARPGECGPACPAT